MMGLNIKYAHIIIQMLKPEVPLSLVISLYWYEVNYTRIPDPKSQELISGYSLQ